MRTLTEEEMEDLLVGGKIMGSGGPGAERVKPLIASALDQGKKFRLIRADELPNSELAVITSTIGGGITREQARRVRGLPYRDATPELTSFHQLSELLGREPYALYSSELGASSTPYTLTLAAMMDKPAVDCDCAGRGKPEISISTTNIAGVSVTPACIVTPFGDSMYLNAVMNDVRAEDMLRSVAMASGGLCGLSRCPVERDALVRGTISGTVSWGIEIGAAIRRSSEPVEAALKSARGVRIFEGSIRTFVMEERDAFTWGELHLEGSHDYAGRRLRMWFKNENLITWIDGRAYATCPDAICVLDSKTGLGISNWNRSEPRRGRRVTVIGVPAYRAFRTERGLAVFGPRHFGFKLDYHPVESLQG